MAAPLPLESLIDVSTIITYKAAGSVRYALTILINIDLGDYVVSIVFDDVSHCRVDLRVPNDRLQKVRSRLGLSA